MSVVSGHIRGETNTLPLHVEILYNEYNYAGAFAVASLLSVVAVVALVLKKCWNGRRNRRRYEHRSRSTSGRRYGSFEALKDVSLRIETGELVALAGPLRIRQDDAAANHRRAGLAR